MFDLKSVIILTIVFSIAALFWRFRKSGEAAEAHAQRYCKQHGLQFLDIANRKTRLALKQGPCWYSEFTFGFSSDRESRYEAIMKFRNGRLTDVEVPPYRTLAEEDIAEFSCAKKAPGKSYYQHDTYS